jgi:hypothetical protein
MASYDFTSGHRPKVLCAGIYLADLENTAEHIGRVFSGSQHVDVVQRWIALTRGQGGQTDVPGTVAVVSESTSKFALLNRLLTDVTAFDWVILCDDDIEVANGFVDALISRAQRFDFALCQPARTHDSYVDHFFVARLSGLLARRTRFVEIGPVVCVRSDAAPLLFPFNENCGMGWGLDFVWPVIIEGAGLRMGIIDSVPVAHRIRKSTTNYVHENAHREMAWTLATNKHLSYQEAFQIIESFCDA